MTTANLQERVEHLETQLAGCATAALGWNENPAVKGDYGWSPSYQDTLDLRRRYESLLAAATEAEKWLAQSLEQGRAYFSLSSNEIYWDILPILQALKAAIAGAKPPT